MKKLLTIVMLVFAFTAGYVAPKQSAQAAAMQSKVLVETGGAKIVGYGVTNEFRLAYDTAETSGIPFLLVHVYRDGVLVGTPIRFKVSNSGARVAADLPGVDPAAFITVDGHITNG
jgi:hypothetical protein